MKKMNKKGFTIVELVIVIAVIAILAAVLIPTFANLISKANESAALQEAEAALREDLIAVDAQPTDDNQAGCKGKFTDITDNGYTYTVTVAEGDYKAVFKSGEWTLTEKTASTN